MCIYWSSIPVHSTMLSYYNVVIYFMETRKRKWKFPSNILLSAKKNFLQYTQTFPGSWPFNKFCRCSFIFSFPSSSQYPQWPCHIPWLSWLRTRLVLSLLSRLKFWIWSTYAFFHSLSPVDVTLSTSQQALKQIEMHIFIFWGR